MVHAPQKGPKTLRAAALRERQRRLQARPNEPKDLSAKPRRYHLAIVAVTDGRRAMVIDGQEQGSHELVGLPKQVFGPDSARTVYVTADGGKMGVVVDGEQRGIAFDGIDPLVQWTTDSRHVAWIAIDGSRASALASPV
jgi:hypothetical protein